MPDSDQADIILAVFHPYDPLSPIRGNLFSYVGRERSGVYPRYCDNRLVLRPVPDIFNNSRTPGDWSRVLARCGLARLDHVKLRALHRSLHRPVWPACRHIRAETPFCDRNRAHDRGSHARVICMVCSGPYTLPGSAGSRGCYDLHHFGQHRHGDISSRTAWPGARDHPRLVYTGLSTGPFIGGILTTYFGWRSIFLVILPLGLFVLWLTSVKVRDLWIDAHGARFDLAGSILYAVSLFGVMYGLTLVPDPVAALWIIAGITILAYFLWWESRSESPVLDISVFRHNLAFTLSNLAAMINYAATYAVAFLLALYFQYTKGFSPEFSGLILVAQPAVQTIVSPFAGRLSDRIEPRVVASVGMILTAAGLLSFAFLSTGTPLWSIVAMLLVLGLGYALFSSPNTNAIMSSVQRRHFGIASSMVATMRALGQLASIAIVMMIFSLVIGRVQVTPNVYPQFLESVQISFLVLGILNVFGIFASYARGKIREAEFSPSSR